MVPGEKAYCNKTDLNLAIVGGGRTCRFFLELMQKESFPYLNIKIVGVCDIDPNAEGFRLARRLGIYTTGDYKELFAIENLDSILELTNNRRVLIELIHQRPEGIAVIEHNIGRLLRSLFLTDQRMKSLEHELLVEKLSSDFLIQHSNAAVVVLDTDFTIADANQHYLSGVGKTKSQVIGAHCYEILHGSKKPCPEARPGLTCPMIETLRTGKSAHVIHEMPGSGSEAVYGNIVTYPLIDQHGRIIRIIEIWRDISAELASRWNDRYKKLKRELNHIIQEDRMISLGKLVASCVHEINNPIQGLLTFAALMQSLLADDELPPEGVAEFRQYLDLMVQELDRCGKIVSGLLSFSRESESTYKETELNEIIQSVVTLTHHKTELQGIELQTTLSSHPLFIKGDTSRLQQCLLNLIFNAMEAMPDGGKLKIVSRIDRKPNKAVIEIEDTGTGISDEILDQIYNPFFTTKPEGQGTGLGLSIVHSVVKVHHGDIQVHSGVGKGSRFVLTFPLSPTLKHLETEG